MVTTLRITKETRAMTTEKSGYVKLADGGRLYYEMAGSGRPVVLGHAGFVDSRSWDDQWPAFAEHFQVVRFDLRGFGQSDPASGPVSRRDDVLQLVRHLGLAQASFVGTSMSGENMLDLALEHPELVSALVLVSATPSGFEMQGEPPAVLLEMMAAMQQGNIAQASELQTRLWVDGPFRQPAQVDPNVRMKTGEMNQAALKHGTWGVADAQPLNPLNPPAVQRLGEVQARTLIIAGAQDHPEILRAADVMAASLPDARKAIIDDAAHLPNMEKPREFNEAVLNFLGAAA
jgi:pimeloyl-ACP methyl ester carboxylesterase